jgi:hypothetical protein
MHFPAEQQELLDALLRWCRIAAMMTKCHIRSTSSSPATYHACVDVRQRWAGAALHPRRAARDPPQAAAQLGRRSRRSWARLPLLRLPPSSASRLPLPLQGVLTPAEVEWLSSCRHKPMAVAMVLSDICSKSGASEQQLQLMNDATSLYVNMTGACERILKTAIPMAYSRWAGGAGGQRGVGGWRGLAACRCSAVRVGQGR